MHWLNIHTPVLRSPEFIGSDPVARATWLYVAAYSCDQENGGVIKGCREWKDRQWQQTCGVTLAEVEASDPLLKWEGDDLVIFSYPIEKEKIVKDNRISGKKGGEKITQAKTQAARLNGAIGGRPKNNPPITQENPSTQNNGVIVAENKGASHRDKTTLTQSKPKRNPSENPTEEEVERKRNRKRNRKSNSVAQPVDILAELQKQNCYKDLNIIKEFQKMQAWIVLHPGRRLNRKFAMNWLNKALEDNRIISVPGKYSAPEEYAPVQLTPEACAPVDFQALVKARSEQ